MQGGYRMLINLTGQVLSLLLVIILMHGICPTIAMAVDWADITSSDVNDWTGSTGHSTKNNFFYNSSASGNTITVGNANQSGGSVPTRINGDIYGAYSSNPGSSIKINTGAQAIDNNSVTIYAPTAGSTAGTTGSVNVYGGFKYNSGSNHTTTSISNNTVTIHSGVNLGTGAVAGAVLYNGGTASTSMEQMNNNRVIIYGGTMGRIAGAGADISAPNLTTISNNLVTIDLTQGGIFEINTSGTSSSRGMIYGADFHGGSVTDNTVNFHANDSSTINRASGADPFQIIAGRSGFYPGEASRNTVNIDFSGKTTDSPTFGDIKGGSSGNNTNNDLTTFGENEAYNNNVYIKGSTEANVNVSEVVGGKTYNGIAKNNNVYLTDVNAAGAIIGGQTVNSGNPNLAAGVADANSVNILRGTFNGEIYGGWDASTVGQSADGNRVNITDAAIGSNSVYGGFSARQAQNNSVNITNATIGSTEVVGGKTYNGIAKNNNVYLTDVNATGTIVGGQTVDNPIPNPTAGVADGNSVTILRGTISGNIYGGWDASTIGQSADGNTVNITDAAIGSNQVYGGFSTMRSQNNSVNISGYGTSFSNASATLAGGNHGLAGNTLTTARALNLRLGAVENFENYIYNMTADEMNQTVYSVASAVEFTGTNHTLNFDATVGRPLQEGQVLVLIDNTANGDTLSDDKFVKNIKDGFLYNYDSFFGMKGDSLVFEILGKEHDDRNITFGQSQLVGLQMVNFASDLARTIPGLYNIQCSARCYDDPDCKPCSDEDRSGPVMFAGLSGGTYNWDTGRNSRVDLDHFSALTGAGWSFGDLLLAGFVEVGRGKYDAKIGGRKVVSGDKSDYIGGGALARYERNSFYGETGFHFGRVKTDFESLKFGSDLAPVHVKYQSKSNYFGLDAILGYKLEADCSTFDFSARYSWSRVESNAFTVHDVKFDQAAANSHRIRAGLEWSYALNKLHPYAGAFYEYEMDSESGHKVLGEQLHQASKKGSSGIGKLGLRVDDGGRGLSLDIGAEGHFGTRRGLAGNVMVGYAF